MIRAKDVIEQIKLQTAFFPPTSVSGGASLEAIGTQDVPLPSCFVVDGPTDATPNDARNGLRQTLTRTFSMIVFLDNKPDNQGLVGADEAYTTVLMDLNGCLLNWRQDPARNPRGFEFGGSHQWEKAGRARTAWQFDYLIDELVTDADGYRPLARKLATIVVTNPTDGDVFTLNATTSATSE